MKISVLARWYIPGMLLFILLSIAAAMRTATKEHSLADRVNEYVNILVDNNEFSGSIIIMRGDELLLREGYGLANRDMLELFTPESKTFIGSSAKQFTALAIMLLQQRGVLNIADVIAKYLPADLIKEYPSLRADVITIHQLLTHTSGLAKGTGDIAPEIIDGVIPRGWGIDDAGTLCCQLNSLDDAIAIGLMANPVCSPGERFEYSNCGYNLLAKIIETVVPGKTFAAFLQEEVFWPMGMSNTFFDQLPSRKVSVKDYGLSTFVSPHDYNTNCADSFFSGAGENLISTADDFARWLRAFFTGVSPVGTAWLEMMNAAVPADPLAEFPQYGYGWVIDKLDTGEMIYFHNGAMNHFSSFMHYYPETETLIVVVANTSMVDDYLRDIDKIVRGKDYALPASTKPIDAEAVARLIGTYECTGDTESTQCCTVKRKGNILCFDMGGDGMFGCFYVPGAAWRCNVGIDVLFTSNELGQINGFEWKQHGVLVFKKVMSSIASDDA